MNRADHAEEMPLSDVRVLDLSRVLAGPSCAAFLADLGADVIKVEGPDGGDETRTWEPRVGGESAAFITVNRNKRGVAVDLACKEGVEVLLDLVKSADVVVENFRTGKMKSYGLDYQKLKNANPKIILCSISAFGQSGPLADRPGYEAVMQAYSGIMAITGEENGSPVRTGVSAIDLTTGIIGAFAITAALRKRDRTGFGEWIDVSLMETAASLLSYHATGVLFDGVEPTRRGSEHPSLVPYRVFDCACGQQVFFAASNDKLWSRLCRVLGIESVIDDPRFVNVSRRVHNRRDLDEIVGGAIASINRDVLLPLLHEAGIPASPVNSVGQFLNSPQAIFRKTMQSMKHSELGDVSVPGVPVKFLDTDLSIRKSSPTYGEDTDEVLREVGYEADKIRQLRNHQIIR